jgi:hypothetical protein
MDAETVHSELRVTRTGEYEDVPDSPLLGTHLADAWYLIYANQYDYVDGAPLADLSRNGLLITCVIEEHSMYSCATGWENGLLLWSIVHDSSRHGPAHLDAQGDLPAVFAAIRDHLSKQQAHGGADYLFDIPIEVAKAITGFRHDESEPTGGIERLSSAAGAHD